jgi:ubiquinone biosynthesis protein COQ9
MILRTWLVIKDGKIIFMGSNPFIAVGVSRRHSGAIWMLASEKYSPDGPWYMRIGAIP